jgi:hypothetical protein
MKSDGHSPREPAMLYPPKFVALSPRIHDAQVQLLIAESA